MVVQHFKKVGNHWEELPKLYGYEFFLCIMHQVPILLNIIMCCFMVFNMLSAPQGFPCNYLVAVVCLLCHYTHFETSTHTHVYTCLSSMHKLWLCLVHKHGQNVCKKKRIYSILYRLIYENKLTTLSVTLMIWRAISKSMCRLWKKSNGETRSFPGDLLVVVLSMNRYGRCFHGLNTTEGWTIFSYTSYSEKRESIVLK